MAYTQAQLVAAYTAANNGVAPDSATTTLLGAFATQTQTGQLSDAAALGYVINSADKTTAVANIAYQFFTGKTPTKDGLDYLTNSTANATDLNDPYYAAFNIENRYMNFAANLGIVGAGATAFNTTYGTAAIPVWSTFVGVIYEQIIGSSYAQAAGINVSAAIADVVGRQAAFTQIARERGIITSTSTQAQIDIATRAVAVGYLMVEGIKADVGVYAAGSNNLVNAMINGNAQYNVNLITTYSPMGGGTGSPVSSGSPVTGGIVGSTFNLTAGVDNVTGTANDDTFNSSIVTANATTALATTFQAIDTINGGAGSDTLNVVISEGLGGTTGAAVALPAASVSAVETINVRILDATGAGTAPTGASLVATNFTGATAFYNDRSVNSGVSNATAPGLAITALATNQAIGIVGLGGASVVGGLTADYNSPGATANTAYNSVINLTGGTGSTTAVGPAITVTSTTGGVLQSTINSNGTTANVVGAVQLDNSGSTVRTLNVKADANLTTGAITGLGGAASGSNAATTTGTINVTGNGNVTLGTLNGAGATLNVLNINTSTGTLTTGVIGGVALFNANATINVSGPSTTTAANASSVTLGALSANVTTLNASGLTAGGVSATIGAAANLVYTGGAGTDTVTIANGTGAAITGAINAGAGTDIIAFNTGADLAANLTALATNFEVLRAINATGAAQVYDPTLINGITAYQIGAVAAGGTTTMTNMAANASVTIMGANAGVGTVLQLKDASGAADVINVRIDNLSTASTGAAGLNAGTLTFGGTATAGQVETVNIVSAGRQSATGAYNTVTLGASGAGPNFADPTNVNVSGSVGITVNLGATAHAQKVDASANTFGVTINAPALGAANTGPFTLIGTSANDTFTFSGAGTDTTAASIYGGTGGDSFVLGTGVQTLVYKAATDSALDLAATAVGAGSGNAQSGVALTGTTKTTSGMDVVANFTTGTDKIDVSTFGFGAGGLGGGIVDKGTVVTDAAFNTTLTTGTGVNGVFGDGVLQRGLAVIHTTAGTSDGLVSDVLLIDVNKDGAFTAGTDIAVKFIGAPGLVITDFII